MKDYKFTIIVTALVVAFFGWIVIFGEDRPERIRLGNEHSDDGQEHVSQEAAPEYGADEPPTSGAHGNAVPKQAYTTELPDYNTIHNLEHGYVYITYRPDLPQEEIDKLTGLFFKPYANTEFSPTKVIMAPRAANESPIVLSSWRRSQQFEAYDEQQMIDYYLGNVNKSPEPAAS